MALKDYVDKIGILGAFVAAACCLGLPVGPDGRIRWSNSSAVSDAEYTRLKNEVLEQPQLIGSDSFQ